MTTIDDEVDEPTSAAQNVVPEPQEPEEAEKENQEELSSISVQTSSEPESEELPASDQKEPEIDKQPIVVEPVQVSEPEIEIPKSPQQIVAVDPTPISSSSSGCQYGFGYLSQREKGEDIPQSCIECAKSLDCMLSQYYKKEESVKEIKKWYSY